MTRLDTIFETSEERNAPARHARLRFERAELALRTAEQTRIQDQYTDARALARALVRNTEID